MIFMQSAVLISLLAIDGLGRFSLTGVFEKNM